MSSSTSYPLPPPDYSPSSSSKKPTSADQEPLLGGSSDDDQHKRPARPVVNAWADDGEEGGIGADFAGLMVSQSSIEIRMAFIRKVYSILFLQIAATTAVGALCRLDASRAFILAHSWTLFIPLLGALVCMLFLYAKRHSSPANIILLGLFTILEAMGIGGSVAFVDTVIVLEALCLTGLIFIGLSLYTLQTKRDFSGMAPYLTSALLVLVLTSFATMFFPMGSTMDAIYAGFGALIFSMFIVYDTQLITQRLSPDDWVLGCISLYLDIVNLFLMLVRLLSDTQDG